MPKVKCSVQIPHFRSSFDFYYTLTGYGKERDTKTPAYFHMNETEMEKKKHGGGTLNTEAPVLSSVLTIFKF